MPAADRGNAEAPPAITMERGTGIREVTLWYPDQSPTAPVPYPWTLRTSDANGGNNISVYNVTLVNAYQAIRIGPEWNELHTIRNVYGTPLKTGIWLARPAAKELLTHSYIRLGTGVGVGPIGRIRPIGWMGRATATRCPGAP